MINERDQLISEKGAIAEFHNGMSFRDAFSTDHEFDAHFTCYYARSRSTGRPVSGMPRVAKSALLFMQSKLAPPKMRDMEVYGHTLALDYDLPAPKQWTDGLRRKVQDHFDMLKAKGSILATPTVFYTTAGGFRLVWALAEAVPVEGKYGLEDLLKGLVAEAHIMGLAVDPACGDWTRLFRLPRVRRAASEKGELAKVTARQSYFRESWGLAEIEGVTV